GRQCHFPMGRVGPGADQLGVLDRGQVLLSIRLPAEVLGPLAPIRRPVADRIDHLAVPDPLANVPHLGTPTNRARPRSCLNPPRLDEGIQVATGAPTLTRQYG